MATEARRPEKAPNPDSMDLYFQGMALVNQRVTLEIYEQARSLFSRALGLDAGNSDAMVGLGALMLSRPPRISSIIVRRTSPLPRPS
jgi:hypothetical protein